MQIGDIIKFGDYHWQVLDIRYDRAFIITECILEQRPYHDKAVA